MDFCTAGFESIERQFYTGRKNQWKTRQNFEQESRILSEKEVAKLFV